jgi:hypothetical protein
MRTITYTEYRNSLPNVSVEDVIESQANGNVMVTVNEMLYLVTEVDLSDEESFVCIDKECEEYTFSFTDIQSIDTI